MTNDNVAMIGLKTDDVDFGLSIRLTLNSFNNHYYDSYLTIILTTDTVTIFKIDNYLSSLSRLI